MTAAPATYKRRPPFFANRFCRLVTKVCLANQIGPEACFLLVTVVMTEDAKSYRSGVTFWNEQLFPLVGLSNVKALARVRDKAVESGWLHYEPGGKGRPGVYWVTIPDEYIGMDDKPADENREEYMPTLLVENDLASGQQSGRKVGTEAGEKRERSGREVGNILPLPNPLPKDPPYPPQAGGASATKPPRYQRAEHRHFAAFWTAYPRKTAKPKASESFSRIDPDDATFAAMLAALDRQRRSPDWCKDDGRFIPHPATWLNQRRWEDLPPEVGKPASPVVSSTGTPYEPYENFIPKPGA
jgi:hypothetical protein